MSPIDTLPPDQQAVLQLLLKQGKSYDEIGAMLRMDRESVRWRAHSGVDALGPPDPADTPGGSHWQIIDYLLGQQTASERAATREALEASPEDRAWARTVAAELRPMAAAELPEIPADPAETEQAYAALDEQTAAAPDGERNSRLGSILLLGGLGLLACIVIILIATNGGDDKKAASTPVVVVHKTTTDTTTPTTPGTTVTTPAKTTTATTPSKTTTVTKTTPAPAPGGFKTLADIDLTVPGGTAKTPIGAAAILLSNGQKLANVVAQGLVPGGHEFAYVVWLANPGGTSHFLGFTPPVVAGKAMKVLATLPDNVNAYKQLLITKETTSTPTKPGTIVLQGTIPKLP